MCTDLSSTKSSPLLVRYTSGERQNQPHLAAECAFVSALIDCPERTHRTANTLVGCLFFYLSPDHRMLPSAPDYRMLFSGPAYSPRLLIEHMY